MNGKEKKIFRDEVIPTLAVIQNDIHYIKEGHQENKRDINEVKEILRKGAGKISVNRTSIKYLQWFVGVVIIALVTNLAVIIM